MIVIIVFFIAQWYLSLFCQTFFHHRYASHKMFTMSKFWEKVFRVFSFLTQGSSYINPHTYGILHRMHHEFADTEKDPHSPKFSPDLFSMMWKTGRIYSNIYFQRISVDPKYTKGLPEWFTFDNFAEHPATRTGWIILYTAFYFYFATTWWLFLLLPITYVMGPFHGAIINWYAHRYGYVNFKVNDTSKNLFPFDFLMMGEGYHNNHHTFKARPNFGGVRWHEFDPVYPIILLFDKLHIIRLRRAV